MRRSPRSRDEGSLVVLLLPERARSECARSTAAVGPTRVALHERAVSELGRIIYIVRYAQWRAPDRSLWGVFGVEEGMETDDLPCSRNAHS